MRHTPIPPRRMRLELAHSTRIITRHRFYSACVILSLGIGMSSSAGVLTIIDSMRFGSLPFRHADRIEHLYSASRSRAGARNSDVPAVVYRVIGGHDSPAEAVAAYSVMSFQVRDRERIFNAWGARTTTNFATLLGARIHFGRAFDSTDTDQPSVILADRFWRTELGADSGVVGRTIDVNGVAHRITGVAAPEWDFPERASMWVSTLDPTDAEARQRRLSVIARVAAGVDRDQARATLTRLARGAVQTLPHRRPNEIVESMSFRDFATVRLHGIVFVLTIIAVFVGFLTVVNFAALVLARGIRRRGEIGVRAALGASVGRLARHIIGESLVLCAIGGMIAAVLAPGVVSVLKSGFGDILPAWLLIGFSWRTTVASALLCVAVGAVFAIGPALDIARPALSGFLQSASSTVADGGRLARTRSWVVGIQVALATGVMISLGALMGRSVFMREPQPGFDVRPLIVSYVSDSGRADDVSARLAGVLSMLQETPGISAAAFLDGQSIDPAGVSTETGSSTTTADAAGLDSPWLGRAGEGFFGVMRPRVIAGRLFTADEEVRGAPVAVISRVVARAMFGDTAIGRRLRVSGQQPLTVVGVVDDIRLRGFQTDPTAAIFTPMARRDLGGSGRSVRQVWSRASGPIPITVRSLDSRATANRFGQTRLRETRSLATSMADEQRAFRSIARLTLTIFGVALGLAALGIYGLVAYTAEMRRRELAVREALGATRAHVAGIVLGGAFVQVLSGALAGALIAIVIVDYLSDFQLKLTTTSMTTLVAFLVIGLTVLVSSIGPLVSTWRRELSTTLRV